MADKYKNKYRIQSHRKPNWAYDADGAYFITICTQHRECNLGEIVFVETHGRASQQIQLSDFGKIVDAEWNKSFEIRNELFCDEYIIMPNHLHAIIILKNMDINDNYVQTHDRATLPLSLHDLPLLNDLPLSMHRLPKSISSFIAGFKSAVNSKIDDFIDANNLDIPKYNRNNHFFQPNYHDIIIKNVASYHRIKQYIIANPQNWNTDRFQNPAEEE